MSFHSDNCSVLKTHGCLHHIMTAITNFWLKSKIYLEKVLAMTNNTFMHVTSFINIYAFRHITPTTLQQRCIFN